MSGDETIAKKLVDFLNTWEEKPTEILFEHFTKGACMVFQQLSGTVVDRKYINGSYLGSFPFAVYVRTDGSDTKSRLDATAVLYSLVNWLKSQEPPDIGENRIASEFETTTPSQAGVYEDGTEDYQITLTLNFYCKGGI